MAKGFPYFKFTATEWLTGDIVFEDFELQGIFVNVCALYWHRDGSVTVEEVIKRLKTERFHELTDRFISVSDGFISIKFLDEQLEAANHISKVNSENGRLGGRPKTLTGKANKPTAKRTQSERKANESKEEEEQEEDINTVLRDELFEKFWLYYKKGSKKVSKDRFMKLSENDIEAIRKHLPVYFANNPEKKFRKDAERYLSNRLWDNGDEKPTLPKDWWNMELTPEQWNLLTPEQRQRKKNNDLRKQFGI